MGIWIWLWSLKLLLVLLFASSFQMRALGPACFVSIFVTKGHFVFSAVGITFALSPDFGSGRTLHLFHSCLSFCGALTFAVWIESNLIPGWMERCGVFESSEFIVIVVDAIRYGLARRKAQKISAGWLGNGTWSWVGSNRYQGHGR